MIEEDFENVELICPKGMFGPEKDYLVDAIIRAIAERHGDESEWPNKYGTNFENEYFSMHRYCWCESEDCKWCGEENAPHFHYKPLDFKVWWYKYIGRGVSFNKQISVDECSEMLSNCII